MSRILKGTLVTAIAVGLSGCYTIEQEYLVNNDLTLTLNMVIEVDLEATEGLFGDDFAFEDGFEDDDPFATEDGFGEDGFDEDFFGEDLFGDEDIFGDLPDDAWTWTDEEWDEYLEEYFDDMFGDLDFGDFDDASPGLTDDAAAQSSDAYEVSGRVDAETFGLNFDDDLTPSDEELQEIAGILGDRFTYDVYETDTVSGVRMTMVNMSIDEANELASTGEVLAGTFDLTGGDGSLTFTIRNADGDDADAGDLALMEGFIDYTGGITMPGEITAHSTGTIDPENPNRLELSLSDMGATEITVTADTESDALGGVLRWLLIGLAALVLLAIAIVVIVMVAKRGQNKTAMEEVPAEPHAVSEVPTAQDVNRDGTTPPQQ